MTPLTDPNTLLLEANRLFDAGRLREAGPLYERLVVHYPPNVFVLNRLARILLAVGNHAAAIEVLRRSLQVNQNQPATLMHLGVALHQARRSAEALAAYEQAAAGNPGFAEAHFNRAVLLGELGRQRDALDAYDRALTARADFPEAHNNRATILKDLQQADAALAAYDRAIACRPDYADAHNNRSVLLCDLKRFDEALASCDRALALRPDYAEAHSNRGNALLGLKQPEAALASYDRALALRPDFAEAHSNRGNALRELAQHEAAVASYDRAIALKPDHVFAHHGRGIALFLLNQPEAALASHDRTIALDPGFADAYANRGNALLMLKRQEAALASFDEALARKPDQAEVYSNRGNALCELRQIEAGLASYDRAIALKPDFAQAYSNRGNALLSAGRPEAAVASLDQAVALKPDFAEAHSNRGNALAALRRLDEAAASYDRAIAAKPEYPDAYWNKSLVLLLGGRFRAGWELYEWRWKTKELRRHRREFAQPPWLGREDLAGKTILLWSEQGLGDMIQVCRYAPRVAALGARVILEAEPALAPLVGKMPGVAQLVVKGEAVPPFDFQCPLLSLPLAFGTELDSIPDGAGCLHVDAATQARWADRLGARSRPRVGLVWSGSTTHTNDHNRSIALAALLRRLPANCQYVSLQKEVREGDQAALASRAVILHFGAELADLADTAALCRLMDVVVAVDTGVAHLAAALGATTWILLPFSPDWRWLIDRDDTPWYPTARLYRQPAIGDWDTVLARVGADLARLPG